MAVAEETIYWVARPSQWCMFLRYVFASGCIVAGVAINPITAKWAEMYGAEGIDPGLFLTGFGVVYAIWQVMVVKTTRYTVTDERFLDESGVLSRTIETLELYRVKDIQVLQPLWLRPFGLGNVRIESSDKTTPTSMLYAVKGPLEAAKIIRTRVEEMRTAKGVREFD